MPESRLNRFFDHVYVINLRKRPDRRVEIIQKFRNIGIEFSFFTAVDGETLSSTNDQNRGATAYLMTYSNLIQDAKENNYQKILCFDDDVLFHKEFEKRLNDFLDIVPDSWKLLYLGATQHTWTDEILNVLGHEPAYFPQRTDGSFALGIHGRTYDLLLRYIREATSTFDTEVLSRIYTQYKKDCLVAFPNLVIADVGDSNINAPRDQYQLGEKVKWDMEHYDYPFVTDLVSVVMPVFNGSHTIEKSIQSILGQSYKNIELIISDDGSTDSTVEIVKGFMAADDRVKLIQNAPNRGCYYARNQALLQCSGKYIAIQDADDVSLRHRLAMQLIPLVSSKALFTVGFIYRSRVGIDELSPGDDGELIEVVKNNQKDTNSYADQAVLGFNTSMYTRSLFEKIGLFWEHRFGADAEFAERILFTHAGVILAEGENIQRLLMDTDQIDGIYERIDDVIVVSAKMNNTNITNKYSREEKKEFESTWRNSFSNESIHHPRLPIKGEKLPQSGKTTERNDRQLLLIKKILESSRNQRIKLENDLAWYSRTYDHLPRWFVKLGGLFRRFNKL